MDLYTLLIMVHVVGTVLGTGGATVAEVNLVTALRDGKIDASDKALMHANYFMLRLGLFIATLSGIFIVWWNLVEGDTLILESDKMWFKSFLVILIVINAVLISKRLIPLWLGAGVSFTAWWMATILGLWKDQPYGFITLFVAFVVLVLCVSGILELVRRHYFPKRD